MSGRTVVINTAVTVLVSLLVSSIGTNFFSPDEVARAQTQFWSLSVAARFALVVVPLVLPYLVLIFARLAWHTAKGLIGWDYPADRSLWFVTSRIAALILVGGGCWAGSLSTSESPSSASRWATAHLPFGRWIAVPPGGNWAPPATANGRHQRTEGDRHPRRGSDPQGSGS